MAIDTLTNNQQSVNNLSSNRLNNVYQQEINHTPQTLKTQHESQVTPKTTNGAEQVVLTDTAKKLNQAQEKAKNSTGFNVEKVESIKKALANGEYKINFKSVAEKMISQDSTLSSIFN